MAVPAIFWRVGSRNVWWFCSRLTFRKIWRVTGLGLASAIRESLEGSDTHSMCFAITWRGLVSGNLHVNCAFGCELVITIHLCESFMRVYWLARSFWFRYGCSLFLLFLGPVYSTITRSFLLCLSLQDVAYKPEEQFVETRKCEPDAGADVVGACERYGISRFPFILVFSITPSIYLEKSKQPII